MVKINIDNYKDNLNKERRLGNELNNLSESLATSKSSVEKSMIISQMKKVEEAIYNLNRASFSILSNVSIIKSLSEVKESVPKKEDKGYVTDRELEKESYEEEFKKLEKLTLKRLKKKEAKQEDKEIYFRPNPYVKFSNKFFSNTSKKLLKGDSFRPLEKALIKANIQMTSFGYLSMTFFTTLIAFIFSLFLFVILLFFNLQISPPFFTGVTEPILERLIKIFWIVFLIPIATFFMIYFFPFLERKSIGHRIDRELPFAAIHMAAISGSMIDPTKIFEIVIRTGEYPALQREFTKILNQINVYGYNLADALRNVAFNSPSIKLSELLNGMATIITSGGDISNFFEQRAGNLLFEHKIDMEKDTKMAETFMDLYVSIVVAAPMILMLLVMMIKISGIGIALSTGALGVLFVLGVTIINIAFITFLHIKQSASE